MKPIACLLSVGVTFAPYSVLALSARTVSVEEAQGISGSVITLEVAPGYGLNINLIPTGEVVKKAWIDDPSRITLSFDGNLCQGATEQQCNNEGATVIHLRQIQPIAFPNLPRSPGGGTLLTLITEGSQGRKIYQFKVMPVSGTPKYTVLNVSSDTPANTPLLRGRNVPLMVDNKRVQNYAGQPQNRARAYSQGDRTLNPQLEQPSTKTRAESIGQQPRATLPNKSVPVAPVSLPILPPLTYVKPTLVSPFSPPVTSSPVDNKLAAVATPKVSLSSNNTTSTTIPVSTTKTPLPQSRTPIKREVVTPKPPLSSNNTTSTAIPVSTTKTPLQPSKVTVIKPQLSTLSMEQANALVRGLVIARQKGQINNKTKVWKQVQSVVLLLRRGVTAQEAAKKVGISLQLVEQLMAWGSSPAPSTFTSSTN